ncbi:formylmethanofuran dehydrogenase subunit B [Desulfosporosinus lacus DSM 15449]|uniref:Formylmethanofuran dehydrogenase subunit B n=1 Tax=Desulfosporosinus lacus DSM 15449 TaxID=1121420 RepID=A0A1M6A0U9_9FIRM|nr:formylmethanofuran dehydrogenase subunit B [Desulfosporosinus lacus DSM 15449]
MRHLSRYSALAKGLFVAEGRKGRKVVVIDVRPTATSKQADEFLEITPGQDFEIATVLRAIIKGLPLPELPEDSTVGGVPLSKWRELVSLMKACHYGVVMFGIGVTESRGKDLNLEQIIKLVGEMNEFTRFYAIPMRGHGNVNGSNQVLTWQTGYPFAVNLSRGYPRYNPGEFSVMDLLIRREVDAALIIATDPGAHLPKVAVEHLKNIPTIVLEPHENLTTSWANVVIPVAPAGVGVSGTFYRMDNVALQVKKLADFPFPSDLEVVKSIKERIADVKDYQRASL